MTERDEQLMMQSIAAFNSANKRPVQPVMAEFPDWLRGEDWEERYDRLYREMKPREQFGKTFSARYRRVA